jgi:hypothetical protein
VSQSLVQVVHTGLELSRLVAAVVVLIVITARVDALGVVALGVVALLFLGDVVGGKVEVEAGLVQVVRRLLARLPADELVRGPYLPLALLAAIPDSEAVEYNRDFVRLSDLKANLEVNLGN